VDPTDKVPKETTSPAQFIRDLWSIADPKWIVEFDLLQYRPTQADPDAKRMSAMFYPVGEVLDNWDAIHKTLDKRNRKQVENIHHGVNPRFQMPRKHGKNSDVSHYVAIWVDVDFGMAEKNVRKQFFEIVEDLRQQGIAPSYILESGRGLHAYWLFDIPYPVADAQPLCAGIQDYFKISDAVHDPRRVLRLPGFINLKDPKQPKWCMVVGGDGKRYSILDFKDFAIEPGPGEEDQEEQELKDNTPKTVSRDPKIEEIRDNGVSEGAGPYGGRHNAAVALAGHYCVKLKAKRHVLYALNEWNKKNDPPLSDDEIIQIVDGIWSKEQIKRADQGPPKQDKEKSSKDKAREKRSQFPWFSEEGEFNAPIMAQWFVREYNFLATPIGENGEGITLYKYEGGVFTPNGASFVRREAHRHLGSLSSKERLNEVLAMLTEYVKVEYDQVNQKAKELINVKNGMLEWRTGKLHEHSPDYRSLIQIDADYDPDAKSEDLDAFYKQVFPDDCIPLVDEFVGYLMIPSTSLQKAFVAIGGGGNGKGTFLKVLTHFLGPRNVSSISLHQIQEDKFAAAGLLGVLANIYHDLDPQVLKSTGKFKSIVSGDPISAERKYKDHYKFEPFARMVFSANEFPRSTDKTDAYFDRLIFVEFPNKFRGTDQQIIDYDLILIKKPKLMSAFLNRGIEGIQRLMKNQKFSSSASSAAAIEAYKRECSNALDFLAEHCARAAGSQIQRKDIYQKYSTWCDDQGMRAVSAKNFAKSVREWGASEHKREGVRMWGGIAWSDGQPPVTSKDEVEMFGEKKTGDSDPEAEF
jgi:P4 family phage/plasmid primase-like protien